MMDVTNVRIIFIFSLTKYSRTHLVFEHVYRIRDDDALIEARQEMKTFLLNRKSATTDDRQQLLFMGKINMIH